MAKDRESRSGKVAPGGGESKSPKHKDKENRKSKRAPASCHGAAPTEMTRYFCRSRKAWPGEEAHPQVAAAADAPVEGGLEVREGPGLGEDARI